MEGTYPTLVLEEEGTLQCTHEKDHKIQGYFFAGLLFFPSIRILTPQEPFHLLICLTLCSNWILIEDTRGSIIGISASKAILSKALETEKIIVSSNFPI